MWRSSLVRHHLVSYTNNRLLFSGFFFFFHIVKRWFVLNEVSVLSSFSFSPWRRIAVKLPWVPEVFSRAAGIFGVLAEGRHIFDRRPKPRAAKPGHYKDLTKTGNRDRKVSGTQGTVKPKYWANLFKYIFFCFILLFTSSSPYRKDQFAVLWFSTSYYCIDPSLRSKRFPAVCPPPPPPPGDQGGRMRVREPCEKRRK